MKHIPLENGEKVLDAPGLSGLKLINSDGVEIVRLSIAPGKEIPEHTLPYPVFFYIINGEAEFLGDASLIAKTGDTLRCPAGVNLGWRNNGNVEFVALVIKMVGE